MNDHDDIFADPWLKEATKTTSLPDDAVLACAYSLFVQFEWFLEAAFFRRTETTDELWLGEGGVAPDRGSAAEGTALSEQSVRAEIDRFGCAFAVPRTGDELSSSLRLLERLIRARVGFYWPEGFLVAGIVDEAAFSRVVGQIERELKDTSEKAREEETEIIKVARELGLCPEPTGTGPNSWQATCPGGTNHPLYMNAAESSFGCGWCKRKGGVEELRAFVKERKARRISR